MESVTLFETTKAAFERFKTHGNRCHYPNHLKHDALKLLSHYSESALCSALGVSRVSLRNWKKDKSQENKASPTFMTLDLDELELTPRPKVTSNAPPLVLHLPHQLSLSLPEQSLKKTAQFIYALVKEFDICLL